MLMYLRIWMEYVEYKYIVIKRGSAPSRTQGRLPSALLSKRFSFMNLYRKGPSYKGLDIMAHPHLAGKMR